VDLVCVRAEAECATNGGRAQVARSTALGRLSMLTLYSVVICVIAAVLYLAVNKHEPSRRVASALKVLIAVAAIVGHLMR
jgi:energy-converting hydrogenase Eha subunit C